MDTLESVCGILLKQPTKNGEHLLKYQRTGGKKNTRLGFGTVLLLNSDGGIVATVVHYMKKTSG